MTHGVDTDAVHNQGGLVQTRCHNLQGGVTMQRRRLTGERLVATFLCGCVLLNYPLLALFDRSAALFGIPLIYVYVFAAWGGLIAVMAWFIERRSD